MDELNTQTESVSKSSWLEVVRFAFIALLIVLPVRWFIAQPFVVSGASMEETFQNSDYLIVDQLTYRLNEPERGDVIVFKYPNDHSKYFIKRIIGLPNETVAIEGKTVTITNSNNPDGFILDEPYINEMSANNNQRQTLGEDEYFVMGDNRDHSSDSRTWGILHQDEIVGRAFLRLLPPANISIMPGSV